MTSNSIAIVLGASLLLGACAHTEYTAYEPGDSEFAGDPLGDKTVVNGMDVWIHGRPTKRFRILGLLDDERPEFRVYEAQLWRSMANEARDLNGDAIIDLTFGHHMVDAVPPTGFDSSFPSAGCAVGNLTTTWTTFFMGRRYQSSFAVIVYLE